MAQTESSDDVEETYDVLSEKEIHLKIQTFRNLCLGNKINANNAFDIDMIGYFSTWLAKNKSVENYNVESFQEIADYLDASGKVYSLRVDNFSLETSKLVEEFRTMLFKKNILNMENENDQLKMPKPKRPKIMLTSADKLKCKTTDSDDFVDPSVKQGIFNFNFKELFESNRPSDYLVSFYHNYSLKEEKQKKKCEKSNDNKYFVSMPDLKNKLNKRVICSKFCHFVTEKDKLNVTLEKELEMEGIENHFDPEDNIFQNSFLEDVIMDENDFSSNTNSLSDLAGLIECIDNVKRDYSFFNPQRLANWKGPKIWKTQAMVKALKSCNLNDRKDIIFNPNVCDDIDEFAEQKNKPQNKKRIKKNDNDVSIKWQTLFNIEKEEIIRVKSKEKMMPRTMNKWDPVENILDRKCIVGLVGHRFEFIKYDEVLPNWRIAEELISEYSTDATPDNLSDVSFEDVAVNNDFNTSNDELLPIVNTFPKDMTDFSDSYKAVPNDDLVNLIKIEFSLDIASLKIEISKIIDQECIDTGSNSKWSKKLLFQSLLEKLNVVNREDLNIPIVFVGLLHLTNERGLKLYEQPNTENGESQLCIQKPLN